MKNIIYSLTAIIMLASACKKTDRTACMPSQQEKIGTLADIDGNRYNYITIGTQVWMTSNLRVTHYRNGDPIINGTTGLFWGTAANPGAFSFANGDLKNDLTYGKYYNVQAVNDPRNIAPTGWHIPTDEEWKILEINQGMSRENADDTDRNLSRGDIAQTLTQGGSSGLSLQVLGYRGQGSDYEGFNEVGLYWTSTKSPNNKNWARGIYFEGDNTVLRNQYVSLGLAVRCIKD